MTMNNSAKPKGLTSAQAVRMVDLIQYQEGAVVSRELVKKPAGNVTVFAFDAGEGLSDHTAPFDALVQILDGEAEIMIAHQVHRVLTGELMLLPAGQPHALNAVHRFKMLLTMIRVEAPNPPPAKA